LKPIILDLKPTKEEIESSKLVTGMYSFKPSFTIPFKYGFSELKQIKELARKVINCKEQTEQKEKEACIKGIVGSVEAIKFSYVQLTPDSFAFETLEQLPLRFVLFIPTKNVEQK